GGGSNQPVRGPVRRPCGSARRTHHHPTRTQENHRRRRRYDGRPVNHQRERGAPVKTFHPSKIRNVALVGHGGAGKTTLAESLLFCAGAINRHGRVEDGTTTTDFDPEEIKRAISLSLSLAPFEYQGHKINILDVPGYADFVGDLYAALRVADLAVFVVSAVEGVEVQTEAA